MEPMGNHRFQVGSSRSHGGLLDQGIWNLCGECHTCTSIYVAQTEVLVLSNVRVRSLFCLCHIEG